MTYFNFKSISLLMLGFFILALTSCVETGKQQSEVQDVNQVSENVAVDESGNNIIHVDINNPDASDSNPGTRELPFKTIAAAAGIADDFKKANVSTTVLIHPGVYRESVELPFVNDNSQAKLVFEAAESGTAIISGSDVWTDWKKAPGPNIYSHHWPYNWGIVRNPWESMGQVIDEIVRRREMVFVNGEMMTQVLSEGELVEKSFYVSESQKKVFLSPPKGVDLDDVTVEVAVRSGLFIVKNRINLELRGLVFQHDNTGLDHSAVEIDNSPNVIIEDCSFNWNNWGGMALFSTTKVTARGNTANYNGGRGMSAFRIKDLLFEDNETSFNNWRGIRGGFDGFAVAGLKHLRIHDGIYRNHTSIGNLTRGFWLDFDNTNIVIENAVWKNNLKDAIFIEANEGPITIKNSAICNNENGRGAIIGGNSENVTIEGNLIYNNGNSQIKIEGGDSRSSNNWETGEKFTLDSKDWVIENNVIIGTGTDQLLIDRAGSNNFLENFTSDGNIWINTNNEVFKASKGNVINFEGWKSLTQQDLDSLFENSMPTLGMKYKELLDICLEKVKTPAPIAYLPTKPKRWTVRDFLYKSYFKVVNTLTAKR